MAREVPGGLAASTLDLGPSLTPLLGFRVGPPQHILSLPLSLTRCLPVSLCLFLSLLLSMSLSLRVCVCVCVCYENTGGF